MITRIDRDATKLPDTLTLLIIVELLRRRWVAAIRCGGIVDASQQRILREYPILYILLVPFTIVCYDFAIFIVGPIFGMIF